MESQARSLKLKGLLIVLAFAGGPTGCTLDANLTDFDLRRDLPSNSAPSIEPKTSDFGVNGVQGVHFSIDKANMNIVAMAQDPVGRLYAFQSQSSQVYYWNGKPMVYRMNADGSLDTSFGVNGYALLPNTCAISQVHVTSAHIYIGCGVDFDGFFITRLLITGEVDKSYGTDGIFSVATDDYTYLKRIVLDNQGRILLAGGVMTSSFTYQWVIARATTSGTPDPTFGTDGVVTKSFSESNFPLDLVVTSDDSILVFGNSDSMQKLTAAKYTSSGTLDTATFASGTGGILSAFNGAELDTLTIRAHLLDNGKFLLTGTWIRNGANDEGYAISLNADGSFDTSFDGDGIKYFNTAANDVTLNHDIILSSNSFRVYGFESCGANCLNRTSYAFDNAGNLNPSWGVAGKLSTPMTFSYSERTFQIQDSFYSIRQEQVGNPAFEVSAIEAIGADLSSQKNFGNDGKVAIMLGTTDVWTVDGSQKLSDGSYVQWGRYQGANTYSIMWKLDSRGKSDDNFGINGVTDNLLQGSSGLIYKTLELSNGDLRICAETNLGHFTLGALKKSGQPDLSFGTNGLSHYDINLQGGWGNVIDCFRDSEDKITVAFVDGDVGYILMKLNPDGSRDTSFAPNGEATSPNPAAFSEHRMSYKLKNGNFIFAGAIQGSSTSLGLVQVRADGTLNTDFGVNGTINLSIDPDTSHDIMGIAEDTDGTLYVLAGLYDSNWNADAGLFSFTANGSLNTAFSEDGWLRTGTSFWLNTGGNGANMLKMSPSRHLMLWGNDPDGNSKLIAYNTQGTAFTAWDSGKDHIPAEFANYNRFVSYEIYNWFFDEDGSIKVFDSSGIKRLWTDGTIH